MIDVIPSEPISILTRLYRLSTNEMLTIFTSKYLPVVESLYQMV